MITSDYNIPHSRVIKTESAPIPARTSTTKCSLARESNVEKYTFVKRITRNTIYSTRTRVCRKAPVAARRAVESSPRCSVRTGNEIHRRGEKARANTFFSKAAAEVVGGGRFGGQCFARGRRRRDPPRHWRTTAVTALHGHVPGGDPGGRSRRTRDRPTAPARRRHRRRPARAEENRPGHVRVGGVVDNDRAR